jgi:endonuclease III related protein
MKGNKTLDLYKALYKKYGAPEGQWKLWCKRPKTFEEKEEVIIGAILTQATNWRNVELALIKLKKAKKLSFKNVRNLGRKDVKKLRELIRPSGFYQSKSKYLLSLADFFFQNGGLKKVLFLPLENLRQKILDLPGIGPETADSILLYALGKPVFVIDEYTRRLLSRVGRKTGKAPYERLRKIFEEDIAKDFERFSEISGAKSKVELYQDFHALIVIDGKNNN